MPRVEFSELPDTARLWVFASDPAPSQDGERQLLGAADDFLNNWQAHGAPLVCARDWRDGRFLAVAVDESATGASGCSVDGLFRTLRSLETRIGARVVSGGSVFYRAADGTVRCVSRDEFEGLAARDEVDHETLVFDTSITTVEAWRDRFELAATNSWHATLLPAT